MAGAMDEILRWVTPGLVVLVWWFVKSLITDVREMRAEFKMAMERINALNTQYAVNESRINRLESDVGMLHGRVSRLITDKILKEADSA